MSDTIEQLAARVAAAPDADAERDLERRLRPGLMFLCGRRVGPKDAHGLANRVIEAVLSRIRSGDWTDTGKVPQLVVGELRRMASEARPHLISKEPDALAVAALAQALSRLSQQSREVVTRYYVYGEGDGTIGERVNLHPEKVRASRQALSQGIRQFPLGRPKAGQEFDFVLKWWSFVEELRKTVGTLLLVF